MIFSFRTLHTQVVVIVPLPSLLELTGTAMKLVDQIFLKKYQTLVERPKCSVVFDCVK